MPWKTQNDVPVHCESVSVSQGAGGGFAISTTGTASTGMPSTADASAAVARLVESRACTVAAVVVVGTSMVAVMITEAAATLMITADASTPAAVAMRAMICCRIEVSA